MEDESRFMTFVRRASQLCGFPVWTWSLTQGLHRDGMTMQLGTQDPKQALAFIADIDDAGVFVMNDLRPALADPAVVRRIKEIALAARPGQSIVITGATASSRGLTAESVLALAVAFFISGALFWLYFGEVAEHSMSDIAAAEDPGSLARDAYTYLHLPIIAGIIMVAVADDLLVAHPGDHLTSAGVVMATAGPAVYLLGESAVRLRMIGRVSPRRIACVVALGVLGLLGGQMSALVLSACVAAALAILAMSEAGWLRRPRPRDVVTR